MMMLMCALPDSSPLKVVLFWLINYGADVVFFSLSTIYICMISSVFFPVILLGPYVKLLLWCHQHSHPQ